tara:strand:+ start:206 stop:478 length:273 start_codon:yes stop_codon:yes gene_type:complete
MNEEKRTVKNTVKPWKVVSTVNTFKKADSKRKALVNEWKKSDVTIAEVRVVKRAIDKFSVKLRLSQVPGTEKPSKKAEPKAKKVSKKGKK